MSQPLSLSSFGVCLSLHLGFPANRSGEMLRAIGAQYRAEPPRASMRAHAPSFSAKMGPHGGLTATPGLIAVYLIGLTHLGSLRQIRQHIDAVWHLPLVDNETASGPEMFGPALAEKVYAVMDRGETGSVSVDGAAGWAVIRGSGAIRRYSIVADTIRNFERETTIGPGAFEAIHGIFATAWRQAR